MSRDTTMSLAISESGVTRQMPKASAVAMSKDALDFLRAAKLIVEQKVDGPEMVIDYFSPIYLLICHAMELSLKAYLRARGYEETALRGLGHSLNRCAAEVEDQGLALTDEFHRAVRWLDGYHLDHAFRYHAERYLHVPLPRPLLMLVEPQITATCSEARAIVREYLRRKT